MKALPFLLGLAASVSVGCAPESAGEVSETSEARCGKGQVFFDGRCAVQCSAGDNTLCELDGTRIDFSAPGGAGSSGSPDCRGVCEQRTPVALALGSNHTCALLDDASVRCFGDDTYGQLGGSRITGPIADLKAASLSSGAEHTCAILADGTVRCWGRNHYGQLGNGTRLDSATPVAVPNLSGVVQLAASHRMTYALLDTGRVVVWGSKMGFEREHEIVLEPMDVGLDQVEKIAATGNGTCALRKDGSIRCYGWHDGMSGGTDPDHSLWLDEFEVNNAEEIACIEKHTCLAVLGDGRVIAWGFDRWGVTGQGIAQDWFRPATVIEPLTGAGVVELAGGLNFACARFSTGEIACWGKNALLQLGYESEDPAGHYTPRKLEDVSDVQELALGTNALHACVRKSDQGFYCWGNDASQQTGGATKTAPLSIP
jgi:alpha-tubulin suppressor-like RCC1 family protein